MASGAYTRRTDKLLTLDRALLIGAFTVGTFVAALEFKNADIATKVEALERRASISEGRMANHDINDAKIQSDLSWIRENLSKLAESTAKFVNVVRDQNTAIRKSTTPKPEPYEQ